MYDRLSWVRGDLNRRKDKQNNPRAIHENNFIPSTANHELNIRLNPHSYVNKIITLENTYQITDS